MNHFFRRFAEESLTAFTLPLWLILAPFSLLYNIVQRLRAFLYSRGFFSSYHSPLPVISVGNLTAGGTGKTPIVDYIIKISLARGERPAVVSRGYGGKIHHGVALVSRGDGCTPRLNAETCGDEPFLLARRNPNAIVVVSAQRQAGIEAALRECGATLIILDDGYQHLAVQRDLNILLVDSRRPLGNGSLLPAGLLREPASAHERAHLCILTRDTSLDAKSPFPDLPVLHCRHALSTDFRALDGTLRTSAELAGLRALAFAGIAAPESFFEALRASGLQIVTTITLDDHVLFDSTILKKLNDAALSADFFVTTEKDGVKLRPTDFSLPCFQASLDLEFSPKGELEERIDSLLLQRMK